MFTDFHHIGPLVSTAGVNSDEIQSLHQRLISFYNTTTDYTAHKARSAHTAWLKLVSDEINRKFLHKSAPVKVLEAGAGLGSSFDKVQGLECSRLHYTAQDITKTVSDRLAKIADTVHIGPLETMDGQFDVIFSLFVLEHVADPAAFLTQVDRLLAPGGTHIVICPRYDVPGYVCPSMRHLRATQLLRVEAYRHARNALTRHEAAEPSFWVNTDPALFHRAWRRDADAIHIVSQNHLIRWHVRRGYRARQLTPGWGGLLDLLVKRFATVSFAFDTMKRF